MAGKVIKTGRASQAYVASVPGDANAAASKGAISNMHDHRIDDGLTDLLESRASNIPEISAGTLQTREANRKARAQSLNANKELGRDTPATQELLKYPRNFPTENDESQEEMQNYIHFRSLERKNASTPDKEALYDIFLYVPNTMTDGTSIEYESGEKGLIEGIMAKMVGGAQGDQGIGDTLWQTFKDVVGGSIVKAASGKVINPMKFQLFKGVGPRSFSYSFELYPENHKQSQEIRHICYAFKKSSLPGIDPGTGNKVYTFPNEWAIRYHGPMKNWIDYPMVSVLTKVNVDYNLAGNARYYDGAPAAVKLDLSFTEVFTLDRVKYDQRVSALVDNGRGLRENTQEGGSYADVMGLERPDRKLPPDASGTKRNLEVVKAIVTDDPDSGWYDTRGKDG